jgi:hypothetical protein
MNLFEDFKAFCAAQPPEKAFVYFDHQKCPLAQFAKTIGETYCSRMWEKSHNTLAECRLNHRARRLDAIVFSAQPRTFGVLVAKLNEYTPRADPIDKLFDGMSEAEQHELAAEVAGNRK